MEDRRKKLIQEGKAFENPRGNYKLADMLLGLISPAKPRTAEEVKENPILQSLANPDPMSRIEGPLNAAIPFWARKLANEPWSESTQKLLDQLYDAAKFKNYNTSQLFDSEYRPALLNASKTLPEMNLNKLSNEIPLDESNKLIRKPAPDLPEEITSYSLQTPKQTVNDWIGISHDPYGIPSVHGLDALPHELRGQKLGARAYDAIANETGRLRSDHGGNTSSLAKEKIWNKIGSQVYDPTESVKRYETIKSPSTHFDTLQKLINEKANKTVIPADENWRDAYALKEWFSRKEYTPLSLEDYAKRPIKVDQEQTNIPSSFDTSPMDIKDTNIQQFIKKHLK